MSSRRYRTETVDAIKIGFIYSSANRSHSLNGAELAERKLNAEGGVHGTPIKVIARGNITGNEHAAEIAEALITEEGVSAIIGPNLSRYAVPIGEVAQQHGIPMVDHHCHQPNRHCCGRFRVYVGVHRRLSGKGHGSVRLARPKSKDSGSPHTQ